MLTTPADDDDEWTSTDTANEHCKTFAEVFNREREQQRRQCIVVTRFNDSFNKLVTFVNRIIDESCELDNTIAKALTFWINCYTTLDVRISILQASPARNVPDFPVIAKHISYVRDLVYKLSTALVVLRTENRHFIDQVTSWSPEIVRNRTPTLRY